MQLPDKKELARAIEAEVYLKPFDVEHTIPCVRYFGRINEVGATLVHSSLSGAHQGDLCIIADKLQAEVIAVKGNETILSPFDATTGLQAGEPVELLGHGHQINLGEGLLGRVVDGLGRPIDDKGELTATEIRDNKGAAPNPLSRSLIQDILPMGVKAIDSTLTCGVGQRVGIFAAAGGGKSTLLGMIASNCEAEVIVLALVGERGREVREFMEYNLTDKARARTVMVVSTSDRPPLERMKATMTATTIAEYFRDQGKNVLLMVDSLTRFARAAREIGLAAGEPPVANGFPPSVFVKLSSLVERAGPAKMGSITAIYTVLVEGDDMNEPIADEVRSLLDGHIILSRKLAGEGHYPAIDINASVSRIMDIIVTPEQRKAASKLRKMLAKYEEVQLLIRVGEYESGQDPETDEAIELHQSILEFLQQGTDEFTEYDDAIAMMNNAVAYSGY